MRHIKLGYFYQDTWGPMHDESGHKLIGVSGKSAVRAVKQDETFIGADFIRIEPGCGFEPHAHAGDHILYVLEGRGMLYFEGSAIELYAGNVAFIPAEYLHAVTCPSEARTAMTLLAIGHPHREISSRSRSHTVSESHAARDKTPPVLVRPGTDNRV